MTIRELAKIAGVSRTTVSRALNDAPEISLRTKQRIVDLAEKRGYSANPMVAALMSEVRRSRVGKNDSILAIVPPPFQRTKWGTGHISNRLFRYGIEKQAEKLGFRVEDFSPNDFSGSCHRVSKVLYERGIQAVLVPSIDVSDPPTRYRYDLEWERFFVAGIGFSVEKPENLDRAVTAQFQSAVLALREMRQLGYRRIGYGAMARINQRTGGRWQGAYLLDRERHNYEDGIPCYELEAEDEDFGSARRWLAENKPEAILGDRYFLRFLLNAGVRIPEDVGFALLDWLPDDLGGADYAGIDQRLDLVGAAAVDLIAERINRNERGLSSSSHVLKIQGQWVAGRSLPCLRRSV